MAALPALLALPAPFLRKVCEKKESRISRILRAIVSIRVGFRVRVMIKMAKKSWGHGKFYGHYNFAYDLAYDLP